MDDNAIMPCNIPWELRELRHQMYAAHTCYIEPFTTFTDARVGEAPLTIIRGAGQTCAITGAQLNAALMTLQHWLEAHQADPRWRVEHRQAGRLQELLQRELSVVHWVCGRAQPARGGPKPLRRRQRARGA